MGQAELVGRKEATALELVDAAIARIESQNPRLNCLATPMFDEARAVASKKLPPGPLSGAPYMIKDLGQPCAGVRQTDGSKALAGYIADHDGGLVTRLRNAGLVIVGRATAPEFGNHSTSEAEVFGATHNPWHLDRTAGGSSGGSAAAVAARMVPAASASDGAGSIRIPASCCGLFGLKPTRGRISFGPDAGEVLSGLAVEHAVTRSGDLLEVGGEAFPPLAGSFLGQHFGVADDVIERAAQVVQKPRRDVRSGDCGHRLGFRMRCHAHSTGSSDGASNASILASRRGSSIGFVS